MKSAICIAALALLAPIIGQAQALDAGARVRVTVPALFLKRHVGVVEEVRGDTIVVANSRGSLAIALADVQALDVGRGTQNQFWSGAALGLGVGALIGAVVGAATHEECEGFCVLATNRAGSAVFAAIPVGAVGLLVGGIVGASRRVDRWERRSLPVRASLGVRRSGGASLVFSRVF